MRKCACEGQDDPCTHSLILLRNARPLSLAHSQAKTRAINLCHQLVCNAFEEPNCRRRTGVGGG